MRWIWILLLAWNVVPSLVVRAADYNVGVELNTFESTERECRITFVLENKGASFDSLRLDLVVFNTESVVYRRMITEMGPVRAGRTVVRTFAIETKCAQVGGILVNDVAACVPGDPNTCLDGLTLTSRIKGVRLYK